MIAVYHHFALGQKDIPAVYHGMTDRKVAWSALSTAFA